MAENTKKKKVYNQEILQVLIDRYGLSKDYIQKSLRGDRVGLVPDKLKKEYSTLILATDEAIKNALNK